jgi:hypothetical protein
MFGKVVRSLCRERGGLTFVAGAIGVLKAVEYALSASAAKTMRVRNAAIATAPPTPEKPRLKISRTRSELGYTYWVLRETGANPNYALFDTWREAMDEAVRRIGIAARPASDRSFERALIPA